MVDAVFQFSGGAVGELCRRTLREVLIFRHFEQGHRKAVSLGKTMCPQFWQIQRSSATAFMEWNCPPTTQ